MIIIQTNSLPLHLKSAFFGFNKAEYRTSLVSKSLPIKNPIFATHSNSATKTMHNVFSDVYAVAVNGQKSLGFEWENVYYIQVGVLPQESLERDTTTRSPEMMTGEYLEFCNRLKRHPAVKDLCYTRMHFHYVWKNGTQTVFYDTLQAGAYTRMVSPGYFSVFGVKGADGCSPEELSKRARPEEMVMTDNLARYLISGKGSKEYTPRKGVEMVGKLVSFNKDGSDSVRVSAVCENQKYNEYTSQQAALYYVRNDGFKCTYASIPYQDLFIRVKADADRPGFVEAFRKEMKKQLRVGNLYLADMRPMSEFRNEQLSDYRSELYTYLAIAGFFLINAFLAVLGTFWFRTQHRREELAIRITSGATPHSLMRLLMGEGILLVTFAYIPALIVAYNLGVADLVNTWPVEWSLGRFIVGGILTYFLLLVVVVFSIWFPARQAMKIQPAEALHGE